MRFTFLVPLLSVTLAACGGGGGQAQEEPASTASASPTPTASANASESPTASESVDPYAPNIGDRALKVGQAREGEGVVTRVTEYRGYMKHPSNPYIVPGKGNRWVGAKVEQCVRKSFGQPSEVVSIYFAVGDRSGGLYEAESSSWDDWPPLPQYPMIERQVQPGDCAVGWMLFQVPVATKVETVQFGDFYGDGSVIAEWQV